MKKQKKEQEVSHSVFSLTSCFNFFNLTIVFFAYKAELVLKNLFKKNKKFYYYASSQAPPAINFLHDLHLQIPTQERLTLFYKKSKLLIKIFCVDFSTEWANVFSMLLNFNFFNDLS